MKHIARMTRSILLKKHYYENVWENMLAHARVQHAQRTRYILARTLVFPLMLAAAIHGWDVGSSAELMLSGFLLLLCAVLVARHRRLERRRRFTKAYLNVAADYLARFSGDWKMSPVDGAGYRKEKRPPDQDLHIFGAASLYQYLCAARTQAGRDRLARSLTATPWNLERTRQRQAASVSNVKRAGQGCPTVRIRVRSRRNSPGRSADRCALSPASAPCLRRRASSPCSGHVFGTGLGSFRLRFSCST